MKNRSSKRRIPETEDPISRSADQTQTPCTIQYMHYQTQERKYEIF